MRTLSLRLKMDMSLWYGISLSTVVYSIQCAELHHVLRSASLSTWSPYSTWIFAGAQSSLVSAEVHAFGRLSIARITRSKTVLTLEALANAHR